MKKHCHLAIASTCLVLALNPLMYAIELRFSGNVTHVAPALSSEFSLNEIVTGRATLIQTLDSPTHASYSLSDFTCNIGGDYPITSNGGGLDITNDFGGVIDSVRLGVTLPGHQLSAPHVLSHEPDSFSLNILYLNDELSSTNLLEQFIFGSILDRSSLRFDVDDSIRVDFELYDLSIIPEPSTAALLLTSIGSLSVLARRLRC